MDKPVLQPESLALGERRGGGAHSVRRTVGTIVPPSAGWPLTPGKGGSLCRKALKKVSLCSGMLVSCFCCYSEGSPLTLLRAVNAALPSTQTGGFVELLIRTPPKQGHENQEKERTQSCCFRTLDETSWAPAPGTLCMTRCAPF